MVVVMPWPGYTRVSGGRLNSLFSNLALSGKSLVYRNSYGKIRKVPIYVKPTTRGRKKTEE
jgi:hypothetical protein